MFAVFPSVDELGHTMGFEGGESYDALIEIDRMLAEKLDDFEGELLVTADHGLTATANHIDLRALVEEEVGSTLAFPLTGKPDPEAVVCESGNAMANVYLRGEEKWAELPSQEQARELAARLIEVQGSTRSRSGARGRRARSCIREEASDRCASGTAGSIRTEMRSPRASKD